MAYLGEGGGGDSQPAVINTLTEAPPPLCCVLCACAASQRAVHVQDGVPGQLLGHGKGRKGLRGGGAGASEGGRRHGCGCSSSAAAGCLTCRWGGAGCSTTLGCSRLREGRP